METPMRIDPYLIFDGRCAEAFRFYEQLLGGTIETIMTYGDAPDAGETPPEAPDRILHAHLSVGDAILMGSDGPTGEGPASQNVMVSLDVSSVEEAERIFAGFAEGGNVVMPIERTFWAERFGMVTDRFGTPWMIGYTGDAAAG
jgi:PhnB protein